MALSLYRDTCPSMGNAELRANLLRDVSKTLMRHGNISADQRETIIYQLCPAFGIELTEQGAEHFIHQP